MSDLLFLLRWLRTNIYAEDVYVRRSYDGKTYFAEANDRRAWRYRYGVGRTPLRALRALAQQLQKEDEG